MDLPQKASNPISLHFKVWKIGPIHPLVFANLSFVTVLSLEGIHVRIDDKATVVGLGPEASFDVAANALAAALDLLLIPDAAQATLAPASGVNSSGEIPPIPKSSSAEVVLTKGTNDASIGDVAPISMNVHAADDKSNVILRQAAENLSCQTVAIGQDHTTDADSLDLVVDNQMVSQLLDDKVVESHEDPVLKEHEVLQIASCSRVAPVSSLMVGSTMDSSISSAVVLADVDKLCQLVSVTDQLKPEIELLYGSVLQPPSLKLAAEVCMLVSPVLPEHIVRDCELQCNIASPVRRDAICLRAVVSSEDASIDLRGSSSSGEYVSSFHDLQEEDQDMDVPYVDDVVSKMAKIEARTAFKEVSPHSASDVSSSSSFPNFLSLFPVNFVAPGASLTSVSFPSFLMPVVVSSLAMAYPSPVVMHLHDSSPRSTSTAIATSNHPPDSSSTPQQQGHTPQQTGKNGLHQLRAHNSAKEKTGIPITAADFCCSSAASSGLQQKTNRHKCQPPMTANYQKISRRTAPRHQ
ncbi:hypothetical protein Nepgr_002675 [Nepenthes gracilis]|uniref:Uncharacterized protein n=1 Tax=Nepenthes gracilis TaxID=150966 RepID=A0AAD3P6N5_NEPGR|nr:hypothetical protein Nepgr_002675 [Nepenthes gracilis]